MGSKKWPAAVREDAVQALLAGATVPSVSTKTGVAIGTLRRWKREARREREPAQVLDMKGSPVDVDPLADELALLLDEDPEVSIPAQMRVSMSEKQRATEIGQFGAAATMQKQIAMLRAELHAVRLTRPKADPLDMPEDEFMRRLHSLAHEWPIAYVEVMVAAYCERVGAVVVAASHGSR